MQIKAEDKIATRIKALFRIMFSHNLFVIGDNFVYHSATKKKNDSASGLVDAVYEDFIRRCKIAKHFEDENKQVIMEAEGIKNANK